MQAKEQVEVLEQNVRPDHVHLVVSISPKYVVTEFKGYLKGKMGWPRDSSNSTKALGDDIGGVSCGQRGTVSARLDWMKKRKI